MEARRSGGEGNDVFADSAAGLNGDTITDFAVGDRIEITGLRFDASRYNSSSGLLELDTGADGSYATQVQLSAGLAGELVATASAADQAAFTRLALMPDTDGDGVGDFRDNAVLVPNPDQRDSDGDGYGNVADPDLNQDLLVDIFDLSLLDERFGSADADADFNGDGSVDLFDLSVLDSFFGGPPGPSYVDAPPQLAAVLPWVQTVQPSPTPDAGHNAESLALQALGATLAQGGAIEASVPDLQIWQFDPLLSF